MFCAPTPEGHVKTEKQTNSHIFIEINTFWRHIYTSQTNSIFTSLWLLFIIMIDMTVQYVKRGVWYSLLNWIPMKRKLYLSYCFYWRRFLSKHHTWATQKALSIWTRLKEHVTVERECEFFFWNHKNSKHEKVDDNISIYILIRSEIGRVESNDRFKHNVYGEKSLHRQNIAFLS